MRVTDKSEFTPAHQNKSLAQTDLIILSELEDNARQPLSKLAKKLRISQQQLSYRLQVLKRRNILGGYYTQINFPMFGYTKYRTMVNISNYTQPKEKEILHFLMHHPNVQWIVECGGKWDFIINFVAKNVIQYDSFLCNFKNRFPRQIQNFDIIIVMEFIELGRAYFTKSYRDVKELSVFGRDYEPVKADKLDLQILGLISEQARITSSAIAAKLGTSPSAIGSRIKKLVEKRIIRGFKPLIHVENMGYLTYKIPFKFQNCGEGKEEEIIEYLKTDVRVVAIIKFIGKWDLEIEFEVDSRHSMLEFIRGIRDKFKDIIKEFELIPLFHEYRYNYFPRDLND
jgi:Lrp/AsnC family leucine-responsive transcriptional regulator